MNIPNILEYIAVMTIIILLASCYVLIVNLYHDIKNRMELHKINHKNYATISLVIVGLIILLIIILPHSSFGKPSCSEGRFGEQDIESCIERYENSD